MEHPQKSWRILLLQNPDEIQRFLLTPWPFEGKSSELAITDHRMLPSRLVKEWRRDSCMNSMMDRNCQALHADTFELVDCRLCSMTFCKGCHKKLHTRCSWHPKSDRPSDACGVIVKVRPQNLFDTVVEKDVKAVLQFWSGSMWTEAAGVIAGGAAGAWVGGLIGSLAGPLGTLVGAVLGAAVGALLGGLVGRAAGQTFIEWLMGQSEETKEKVKLCMVLQAMMKFNLGAKKPSELKLSEVRMSFRALALEHHPDKTGLSGRVDLSDEENEKLEGSVHKFQDIQHDCEILEAFIKERETWKVEDLQWLDKNMPLFRQKHKEIDEEADRKRKGVAQGLLMNGAL